MDCKFEILEEAINLYIEKMQDKSDRISISIHGTSGYNRINQRLREARYLKQSILEQSEKL